MVEKAVKGIGLSGVTPTETHTHKDLVNVLVRNNVLEVVFAE